MARPLATTVLRVSNSTAQVIADYAKAASIDVIIIGATGRGTVDCMLMVASQTKSLGAHRAPCCRTPDRQVLVEFGEGEFALGCYERVVHPESSSPFARVTLVG